MDASGKKKYIVQLLPSYEMNIESWQPEPEGGSSPTPTPPDGMSHRHSGKTSQVLTTWSSPHMKAITVLLYQNYS